jgi:putative addiction module component (TIGR02574 family)
MSNAADVLVRALELPDADRAELANRLLMSLPPAEDYASFDERWRDEIEARLAAVRSGATATIDWEEAAARIEHALAERKIQ